MIDTCPDCGALDDGIGSCRELFESFLALEFSDGGYGEVHAFTVGIYMIQHYRYADAALDWVCRNLRRLLDGDQTTHDMRFDIRDLQSKEKPAILRKPADLPLKRIQWKMTIADVAMRYEDAASYRALIREWAESVLRQSGY